MHVRRVCGTPQDARIARHAALLMLYLCLYLYLYLRFTYALLNAGVSRIRAALREAVCELLVRLVAALPRFG